MKATSSQSPSARVLRLLRRLSRRTLRRCAARLPNPFAPRPPAPGEGYRLLAAGETIAAADEYTNDHGRTWHGTQYCAGCRAGTWMAIGPGRAWRRAIPDLKGRPETGRHAPVLAIPHGYRELQAGEEIRASDLYLFGRGWVSRHDTKNVGHAYRPGRNCATIRPTSADYGGQARSASLSTSASYVSDIYLHDGGAPAASDQLSAVSAQRTESRALTAESYFQTRDIVSSATIPLDDGLTVQVARTAHGATLIAATARGATQRLALSPDATHAAILGLAVTG